MVVMGIVAPPPPSSRDRSSLVRMGSEPATGIEPPPAWGPLYDHHADFVWRSLRRMGLSTEDAKDALHEVFLIVHKRWDSYDPSRGSTRNWLFGIAANVARSERRKRRCEAHADSAECFVPGSTPIGHVLGESSWRSADGHSQLTTGQLRDALSGAIAELPPEQRAVFSMFELEGLEGSAIADELAIPIGTVYSRLHGARTRLQAILVHYARHTPDTAHPFSRLQRPSPRNETSPQPRPDVTANGPFVREGVK